MDTNHNPQLELAYEFVCHTNKHIFLTGKAGTGKTTFLQRIRNQTNKRLAVSAPTGVAAINAQGVTVHSLFQLPFGPIVPGQTREEMRRRRFSSKKINLIKSLDLLVIDEISMVRADVLDAIDQVLRRYKDYSKPFGGIQLLMIGDLHQLPPVVKQEEWELLEPHYNTAYFFGSQALQKTNVITIELKHIYRQSDSKFIELLNKVRGNHIDHTVLEALNSRYKPDFHPSEDDDYITLTSHNLTSQKINTEKLDQISGSVHRFEASLSGDFPSHAYPTEVKLEFKKNAQVMFVKNDSSPEKLYYNGKIGRITKIDSGVIYVHCPGETENIAVMPEEWKNMKYELDDKSKEIEEKVIGTFTQYPLKLAWAITIHKSQGLTFERVIIDAQSAFAHGQVYVALSRCKSFEGIVLRSKIAGHSIKTDPVVQRYSEVSEQNQPGEKELQGARREYQQNLLRTLFNFKSLNISFDRLHRVILENENALQGSIRADLEKLKLQAKNTVINFAGKFSPQLEAYLNQPEMPEENEKLKERLRKASTYFSQQLQNELLAGVKELQILTDNTAIEKKVKERLEELKKALFIKNACFLACKNAFSADALVKAKVDAELDFEKTPVSTPRRSEVPKNITHQKLYDLLSKWRADVADEQDVPRYVIASTKTLIEISEVLPTSSESLKRVHGIGKQRIEKFGKDILNIVLQYCQDNALETDQLQFTTGRAPKKPKPPKPDTKAVTFELFKDGKSIEEIAKERSLVASTIEKHLSHYVSTGEIDVFDFVKKEKVDVITSYFEKTENRGLTDAVKTLGEGYSYSDLHMVLAHMKMLGEKGVI